MARAVLKALIFLTVSLHLSSAVTHSLQYIYTAVTGINFPEYTAVGQVDGGQFVFYDSNIRKMIPKTEWIQKHEGEDYWSRETQKSQSHQETFKANVDILMQRFNQTKGVHTVQMMYGCELDDDGTIRGYSQYGYDGEDFLSFDLKTKTWTAAKPQAVITKYKWDPDAGWNNNWKNYLENICIEWIKKYVTYGRETLERKGGAPIGVIVGVVTALVALVAVVAGIVVWKKKNSGFKPVPAKAGGAPIGVIVGVVAALVALVAVVAGIVVWKKKNSVRPEASLFQKHSPSPEVVCHATGFFPKAVVISWQKDGEEVHEDVDLRETLPNQDGSFQKRSILRVPAEELQKHTYICVIQHSSLEKELVLEVPKGGAPFGVIVGVVAALVALVAVVAGIVVWKKKNSGERRKEADVKFSENRFTLSNSLKGI
ncbi:hypothetical protein PDJAM_G00143890 [Pangasius djambal]|uniref:Uncharacterized protein n=1 Tax=Pangasius djambal TaxID=1691987 RepID=A0ACC5ZHK6_9TELE|nr:hypothetical protein [Pangasius djambal]